MGHPIVLYSSKCLPGPPAVVGKLYTGSSCRAAFDIVGVGVAQVVLLHVARAIVAETGHVIVPAPPTLSPKAGEKGGAPRFFS